jgi:plasmid stabilization system protein ParE
VKSYGVVIDPAAAREMDALLAEGRGLEGELARAFDLLSRFPEIGAPRKIRGRWSMNERRWILGSTPFRVYYSVNREAEIIAIRSVRHVRQRQPKP